MAPAVRVQDIGTKAGKYHSINFPLREGIDDMSYEHIFKPVISAVMAKFRPGAIVLQCGADSLTGDRLGCFNLTLKGEFVGQRRSPHMFSTGWAHSWCACSRPRGVCEVCEEVWCSDACVGRWGVHYPKRCALLDVRNSHVVGRLCVQRHSAKHFPPVLRSRLQASLDSGEHGERQHWSLLGQNERGYLAALEVPGGRTWRSIPPGATGLANQG